MNDYDTAWNVMCTLAAIAVILGFVLFMMAEHRRCKSDRESTMKIVHDEIDLKMVAEHSFVAGHGVITLSAHMTDEQILTLIKGACTWSKGKAFQVIPPKTE